MGGARHQSACAVAEGEEVRAGAALVPGPDADRVGVRTRACCVGRHSRSRAVPTMLLQIKMVGTLPPSLFELRRDKSLFPARDSRYLVSSAKAPFQSSGG